MIINAALFKCDRCRATSTREDAKDFPDGWVIVTITDPPQGVHRKHELCGDCGHLLGSFLAEWSAL